MLNIEFLLTSLVVILIPGTGAVYTITTGLTQNKRASLVAALGCTLGILPHITASILGLSAILHMSAQIFSMLKFAGAAYLLYLAWQMWRDAGELDLEQKRTETSAGKIILKAIGINLLNPKLTIFFFTFLPMFLSENTVSPTKEMLGLSIVFMLLTFLVFAVYGLLASSIGAYVRKTSNVMKRFKQASALILTAFAVKLVLTDE